MKPRITASLVLLLWLGVDANAQVAVEFTTPQVLTNREVLLTIQGPRGQTNRVETSADLRQWSGLSTIASSVATQALDSSAPWLQERFYRLRAAATNAVTGDHLSTTNGEVTIHPVNHASLVLTWNGTTIYCDPVGAASVYAGLPRADLVLVTHDHSDHFSASTIAAVTNKNGAVILAPRVVYQALSSGLKAATQVLTNGASMDVLGMNVRAIPAYNTTSTFHTKGSGNGYILTMGGKQIYISGDTEDTPELLALQNIDVAFVCMNLPYTMSVAKAISAVREFRPKVVYVYHYSGYSTTDVNKFKAGVGTDVGVEVRLRRWE